MSTKRILWITAFGVVFVLLLVGVVFLNTHLNRDSNTVLLPETSEVRGTANTQQQDFLNRVEVTRETIQSVIGLTLTRPQSYYRSLTITNTWDGGQASYDVDVAVTDGVTSLRMRPPSGGEKFAIITPEKLYVWYSGDTEPYTGDIASGASVEKVADEWQMIVTYEDVLNLDKNEILDAGYEIYGGEECVYAVWFSPLLGYTRKYYVSLELGLITGTEEYDDSGALVYSLNAGPCTLGIPDPNAFTLPNGSNVLDGQE